MAEKKYSESDQKKMMQDFMNDCNARGADFKDAHITSDGGIIGAIKEMKQDLPFTIDQSQAWTEHNRNQNKKK